MNEKNDDSAIFSGPEISGRDENDLENEVENELLESSEESDGEEPDSKKSKMMEEPTKEVKQVKTVRELRAESQQSNQSGTDDSEEAKHIELIHVTEKPAFMSLNCTFSTCNKKFKSWNQLCKHTRIYHYIVGIKCDRCPIYLETEDDLGLHIGRLLLKYFLRF